MQGARDPFLLVSRTYCCNSYKSLLIPFLSGSLSFKVSIFCIQKFSIFFDCFVLQFLQLIMHTWLHFEQDSTWNRIYRRMVVVLAGKELEWESLVLDHCQH